VEVVVVVEVVATIQAHTDTVVVVVEAKVTQVVLLILRAGHTIR
jgi:hypothetical protein